jgi:hypothetical protein
MLAATRAAMLAAPMPIGAPLSRRVRSLLLVMSSAALPLSRARACHKLSRDHPERGQIGLVMKEHGHVAVEIRDAPVAPGEGEQRADVGNPFGQERKLDLRHRISPTRDEHDRTLPNKGLFEKSDAPTASFPCLPPQTSTTR